VVSNATPKEAKKNDEPVWGIPHNASIHRVRDVRLSRTEKCS